MNISRLELPDDAVDPPSLPLPWRPSERLEITHRFFKDNLHLELVRNYIDAIQNRYVITDIGVPAVTAAIGYTSIGADVFYGRERTDRSDAEVQTEFERDVLGLEPLPTRYGLRHHESAAGFGGGTYPIRPFADLVCMSPESLNATLNNKHFARFGRVILRNQNLIVPVKSSKENPEIVYADRATELSEEGIALLDTALWIADTASKEIQKETPQ